MNKLIIYGTGNAFANRIKFFNQNEILAFVDKDPTKIGGFFWGLPIISPRDIKSYDFDRIIVTSVNYLEEIIDDLVIEYNIEKEKITSVHHYIETRHSIHKYEYIEMLNEPVVHYLKAKNYTKILDIDGHLQNLNYLNNDKTIDAICMMKSNIPFLYHNTYHNLEQIQKCGYDVLIAIAPFTKYTIDEFIKIISADNILFKTLIITVPFVGSNEYEEWAGYNFSSWGYVTCYNQYTSKLLIIETEHKWLKDNSAMFTVTHKKFDIPVNHVFYNIIHAGRENNVELGFIGDNSGKNISSYNSMINECTALYWLWKNDNHDYIGLCHYRRYFISQYDNEIIMREELTEILNQCDIIVAQRENLYPLTVKEQLYQTINENAFEETIAAVKSAMLKKQPLYLNAFDYVMQGNEMFPCNMFFANKKIVNFYCKWLFSFILDVCNNVDLQSYDDYSKRAVGFIAERLFTVWLIMQSYRIKELEIKLVDFNALNSASIGE